MRLFSYQSRDQVRSARLIDGYGIDLNSCATLYMKTNPSAHLAAREFPTQLDGLLLLGPEGLRFAQEATDWAMDFLHNTEIDADVDRVIFDINKVSLLSPISRPGKVICIAGNYPAPGKMEKPESHLVG
jgi:hypothetical protein